MARIIWPRFYIGLTQVCHRFNPGYTQV
jgi:hypothetical protein